jgi:hypothetical protein
MLTAQWLLAVAWWSAAWSFVWTGIIFYVGYRFGLRHRGRL